MWSKESYFLAQMVYLITFSKRIIKVIKALALSAVGKSCQMNIKLLIPTHFPMCIHAKRVFARLWLWAMSATISRKLKAKSVTKNEQTLLETKQNCNLWTPETLLMTPLCKFHINSAVFYCCFIISFTGDIRVTFLLMSFFISYPSPFTFQLWKLLWGYLLLGMGMNQITKQNSW